MCRPFCTVVSGQHKACESQTRGVVTNTQKTAAYGKKRGGCDYLRPADRIVLRLTRPLTAGGRPHIVSQGGVGTAPCDARPRASPYFITSASIATSRATVLLLELSRPARMYIAGKRVKRLALHEPSVKVCDKSSRAAGSHNEGARRLSLPGVADLSHRSPLRRRSHTAAR